MKRNYVIALSILAIGVVGATHVRDVDAADHLDPSGTGGVTAGEAADIADVYVWHSDDTLKAIITFAGPVMPGTDAAYADDVLYTLHIDGDDDDDGVGSDHEIYFRFGQDDGGAWGVWAEGLPGADADVVGATGVNISSGTAMLHAGQFDDPFFFDLMGFQQTVTTGALAFNSERDFFAGQNINAIVIEFPLDELAGERGLEIEGPYNFWVTTGEAL